MLVPAQPANKRHYVALADLTSRDHLVTLLPLGLGIMYVEGRGVPQDLGEGTKWYRKAAEQGSLWRSCGWAECTPAAKAYHPMMCRHTDGSTLRRPNSLRSKQKIESKPCTFETLLPLEWIRSKSLKRNGSHAIGSKRSSATP